MDKTLINIKTERKTKEEAQKVAKDLGLPLGTIINAYLRELIREKHVLFSVPPMPNKQTQKLLKMIQLEAKAKRKPAGPFTYNEAISYLDKLR